MSEVGDALQMVIVSGRIIAVAGRISYRAALFQVKLLNTLYLSKWKGKSSLNRLRKIKGDNLIYLNFSTENAEKLKLVEKELTDHQILFAKLPDLCGGDGRTQYALAASDIGKLKAFLLDHNNGPCKEITAGLISAMDYAETGRDINGKETKELQALEKQAAEELKQKQEKQKKAENTDPKKQRNGEPDILSSDKAKLREQLLSETKQIYEKEPIAENETWGLYRMTDDKGIVLPKEEVIKAEDLQENSKILKAGGPGSKKHFCILDRNKQYPVVSMENIKQASRNGKTPEISYDSGREICQMLDQEEKQKKEQKKNHTLDGKNILPGKILPLPETPKIPQNQKTKVR